MSQNWLKLTVILEDQKKLNEKLQKQLENVDDRLAKLEKKLKKKETKT